MSDFNFPLGIASGDYFCNRVAETGQLIQNLNGQTHTVLISPRRYGKTSLVYRAINKCKLAHVKVDLYMTTNSTDIERLIIKGINELIGQISGVTQKLLDNIKGYVKSLKPILEATPSGFKLILEPTEQGSTPENICEALKILDQILIKKEKKAVLFIDEFQEVERVAPDKGIEGAIRHVAQEAQCFSIIFSGSRRNLLKSMFNNRNKPLYRLCDEIYLDRIEEKDYLNFVNKFSKEKWKKPFTPELFDKIIHYTERHPYYFNALLRKLFASAKFPTPASVGVLWQNLAERKRNDLVAETKSLTIVHKKLLVAIANGINTDLTGKNFLSKADLSGASAVRGLDYLVEEDFIEKSSTGYHMIDPLLKMVLQQLQSI